MSYGIILLVERRSLEDFPKRIHNDIKCHFTLEFSYIVWLFELLFKLKHLRRLLMSLPKLYPRTYD